MSGPLMSALAQVDWLDTNGPFWCSKPYHRGAPVFRLGWVRVSRLVRASKWNVLLSWMAYPIAPDAPRGVGRVPMVRFGVVSHTTVVRLFSG